MIKIIIIIIITNIHANTVAYERRREVKGLFITNSPLKVLFLILPEEAQCFYCCHPFEKKEFKKKIIGLPLR